MLLVRLPLVVISPALLLLLVVLPLLTVIMIGGCGTVAVLVPVVADSKEGRGFVIARGGDLRPPDIGRRMSVGCFTDMRCLALESMSCFWD